MVELSSEKNRFSTLCLFRLLDQEAGPGFKAWQQIVVFVPAQNEGPDFSFYISFSFSALGFIK